MVSDSSYYMLVSMIFASLATMIFSVSVLGLDAGSVALVLMLSMVGTVATYMILTKTLIMGYS